MASERRTATLGKETVARRIEGESAAREIEGFIRAVLLACLASTAPGVPHPGSTKHVAYVCARLLVCREDYSSTFLDQMKQRFLSGQDDEVDYAAIDRDAGLDDDLAAEATRDFEERYFDA